MEEAMNITRRTVLAGASALAAATGVRPVWAQDRTPFTVTASPVMQVTLLKRDGSGAGYAWAEANNREVELITLPTVDLHDRYFREASLGSTSINVGQVVNRYMTPRTLSLLEPLDSYMEAQPIPELSDVPQAVIDAATLDGSLRAIPFFTVIGGLMYNEELFKERGVDKIPTSIEEVVEVAKKMTFERADGSKVIGLSFDGARPTQLIDFIRAFGGEFVTPDFKIHVSDPGTVKAIATLAELYQMGAVPQSIFTWNNSDVVTLMRQGQGAMSMSLFQFGSQYNAPGKSEYAGSFKPLAVPMSSEVDPGGLVAPRNETWYLSIPANSENKEGSWDFIRNMMMEENLLSWAKVIPASPFTSTFQNPVYDGDPYATEIGKVLDSSILQTNWDNYPRAEDLFKDAVQLVCLGRAEPQEAMDRLAEQLVSTLPKG